MSFTGRVPREEVPAYLAAMDVASLPQSVDALGSFRYTTKLSEYLAAGLPVVTNAVPLSYDLPGEWFFRLGGRSPWDDAFIAELSQLMSTVTSEQVADKRAQTALGSQVFELEQQLERFTQFIRDRCAEFR